MTTVGERRAVASLAQERMWFLSRWEERSPAHNVLVARRLLGPLDHGALRDALTALARRHEALRTRFESAGSELQQVMVPDADLPLLVHDVRGAAEPELRRLVREEAGRGFDLSRSPLLRATLLQVDERDHVLVLNAHHAIFDEWSAGVLGRDLGRLYVAAVAGEPAALPDLQGQYAEYAAWEREWAAGPEAGRQLDEWRRVLLGAPAAIDLPLDLPLDRPRPPRRSYEGGSVPVALAPELVADLSREAATTPFVTLLATFVLLLHRWTGCTDLVVAVPVANRPHARYRDVVGLFTNTLALRFRVDGDEDGRALLRRVREVVLDGLARQQVPFDHVVRAAGGPRDGGVLPLAQVMFAFTEGDAGAMDGELARCGLSAGPFPLDGLTSKFDLSLCLSSGPAGISGSLEYAADVLDEATARQAARQWQGLAGELARWPDRPVHLHLAPPYRPPGALATAARVDEVVLRQALRDPGRPAASEDGHPVAIGRIVGGAASLADRLAALGLQPHAPVLVALEPGPAALVAWLGVLRAGGVVVPIAPARLAAFAPPGVAAVVTGPGTPPLGLPAVTAQLSDDFVDPSPGRAPGASNAPACLLPADPADDTSPLLVFDHASLLALVAWVRRTLVPGGAFRVLGQAPLDTASSLIELIAPMCLGGEVVFRLAGGPGARVDFAVAGELDVLRGEGPLTGVTASSLVVVGDGVASTPHLRGAARCDRLMRARFVAGCLVPCSAEWVHAEAAVQVDVPLAVSLLDRRGRPVLPGARGELCLAGPGVTSGVAGRPGLTAAMLHPDDRGAAAGRRLHTSDLVRARASGGLELVGQSALVERALRSHPDVAAAAVVTIGGLVAFVAGPRGEPAPAEAKLLDYLRARLPEASMPAKVRTMPALPSDPSGNVDRKRLRSMAAGLRADALLQAALQRRRTSP